jgi:cobalt/nickel transport system permease protein
MINVPVLPHSSGHLVGGVLLAIALGPARGALTMAVILALQSLLLGDGGLAALGVNIFNMALLPAALVAAYQQWSAAESPAWQRAAMSGVLAAVATMLAAGAIVLQVAAFRTSADLGQLPSFAASMLGIHALIALGEGLLTAALVYALGLTTETSPSTSAVPSTKFRWAALAVATLVLLALIPVASSLPDGYEASAETSAWHALLVEESQQLAALGTLNQTLAVWQEQATTALAGVIPGEFWLALVATLATGAVSLTLIAITSTQRKQVHPSDAN